jgi:hypothetical protein
LPAEWIAGAIDRGSYQPIIQAWHFPPGENFVLRMQEIYRTPSESWQVVSHLGEDAEINRRQVFRSTLPWRRSSRQIGAFLR